MSHFVVMVVGEDIDSILAPYDENLEGVEGYIDRTKEADSYRLFTALWKSNC